VKDPREKKYIWVFFFVRFIIKLIDKMTVLNSSESISFQIILRNEKGFQVFSDFISNLFLVASSNGGGCQNVENWRSKYF